jgi:hypothetical protein
MAAQSVGKALAADVEGDVADLLIDAELLF